MINNFSQTTTIETESQLPIATRDSLGVVKPRNNLTIDAEGNLDAGDINKLQSNWTEANPLSSQYIQNKIIALSQLVNDEAFISSITGLITQGTNITVTGTGTPGDPYIISASGGGGGGITQLVGDVLAGPGTGSQSAALSNTGVSAGTVGDATHVARVTVDAKGRITSISAVAITQGITQLTGDATAGPGSGSLPIILGSVNANPGLHGDATHVPRINTDAKGRILSVTDVPITGAGGITQLTGDVLAGPGSGSQPATLVATGVIPGSYGDGTHVPVVVVDAKGRILSITTAGIPGIAGTSFPTTESLGILHTGVDQTAALNAIFLNANYKGIVMDFLGGGAITITGTVNCQGKTIVFMPGTYFTGTGTVLNHVSNPLTVRQKCYDTTVNIANSSCGWDEFSAQWYGVIADNLTDNGPLLTRCSSMLVTNAATMPKVLRIPAAGNYYKMDSPWFIYNFSGGVYQQVNITVIGQDNAQSALLSGFPRLRCTFQNTFAIGIQHPNGGAIRGVSIEGPLTTGIDQRTMYDSDFGDIFPSARNTQWSPFSGIVMDPFRGLVPPDGGYPGMTSFYQGVDAIGGGTDFFVQECHITGFTVGIMFTPNGKTQQGEDCGVRDCEIIICNVAEAWGQAQSDKSFSRDTRHWYYVWTVFSTDDYGQGPSSLGGTLEEIDGVNIAALVKRLFNIRMVEKHCSIRNVYTENLYEIGLLRSDYNKIYIFGSTFTFAFQPIRPKVHLQCKNLQMDSSLIKYYDDLYSKRPIIENLGGTLFQNCQFDQAPLVLNPTADVGQVVYINCNSFDPTITKPCVIGSANYMTGLSQAGTVAALYGTFSMQDFTGLDSNDHSTNGNQVVPNATVTYSYKSCNFDRWLRNIAASVVLTIDPTNRTSSFTTSFANLCKVNDYCLDHSSGFNLGRISSIVGSTINLIEIPDNIANGTYSIDLIYWLTTSRPFMGDTTVGSPNVTNVVPIFNAPYCSIGDRIDHPSFVLGTYIVSYNNATRTAVMSSNALITDTRINFANGDPQEYIKCTLPPTNGLYASFPFGVLSGAIWTEVPNSSSSAKSPVTWIFNVGGSLTGATFYNSPADFFIQYNYRRSGGVLQYFDPYLNTWNNV